MSVPLAKCENSTLKVIENKKKVWEGISLWKGDTFKKENRNVFRDIYLKE